MLGRKILNPGIYTMRRTLILILVVVVIMGCDTKTENRNGFNLQSIKTFSQKEWDALSSLKIYFGHQSVGYNILEGVQDIQDEYKLNILPVKESISILQEQDPVFAHTTIGTNTEPVTKIDDFADKIREINGNVDIAFMKLCYVDITPRSNIPEIFNHYKKTLASLKAAYPGVTFVHFTSPLTYNASGIKNNLKRMLGKDVVGFANNLAREQYNEMIRSEYRGKEPVFDIAAIESTNTDGQQTIHILDGTQYTAMEKKYTYDGGHLNELGRKTVAEQLLIFLLQFTKR
jgi:hypothetical protein